MTSCAPTASSDSASAATVAVVAVDGTTTCGSRWLDEETKTLISVWGEENVQQQLDGAVRNKVVYEQVAKKMNNYGYKRDRLQCRNKIKNLKKEYRTVKDHNNETGRGRKTCKFFEELDEILGHRPASTPRVLVDTGRHHDIDHQITGRHHDTERHHNIDHQDTGQHHDTGRHHDIDGESDDNTGQEADTNGITLYNIHCHYIGLERTLYRGHAMGLGYPSPEDLGLTIDSSISLGGPPVFHSLV